MSVLNGGAPPSIKVEHDNSQTGEAQPRIKPDPDSLGASPASLMDEDIYEDAGDLDFGASATPVWLTRIPRNLWENWSKMGDDEEIRLGTVRLEGTTRDIKRLSLLLSSELEQNRHVPKEYNMQIANKSPTNTFIFTEKDLPGYESKVKPSIEGGTKFPPLPSILERNRKQGDKPKFEKGKKWQPYFKKAVPKQTALAGQVQREINCVPVENEEYRRVMEEQTLRDLKPKRETKFLVGNVSQHAGNLLAPGTLGANGNFSNFIKTSGVQRGRPQEQKAARMPQNELLDRIYDCFKQYDYWQLKTLKARLNQPEAYLKQVLESVAQLVRQGPFALTYVLKPEAKYENYANAESYDHVKAEMAPDSGYSFDGASDAGDGDEPMANDDEDEENVKMEDVIP